MSQYPSPYQPPDPYAQQWAQYYAYGQSPYDHAMKPARRASIVMFILGGLFLLCGTCTLIGAAMPSDPEATAAAMAQFSSFLGGVQMPSPDQLPSRTESLITGILQFTAALTLLALGVPVRRGSRPAAIAAVFATIVLALVMAVPQVISASRFGEGPIVAGAVCVLVPLSVPFVLLLVWLAQAMRMAPMAGQLSAYQQQYQQYMQAQMYAQWPYGQTPGVPAPPPGQAPVQGYAPPPPPPPSDGDVR